MKYNFKRAFDAVNMHPDRQEQIRSMLASRIVQAHKEASMKKVRKLSSMVAIAAIITVMLSATVLATVGFTVYENPAAMLRAFFGENGVTEKEGGMKDYHDEEKGSTYEVPQFGWERVTVDETLADELIAPYISAETASVSWNGYTLTVEANLYDPVTESGILYYTIENPDGVSGYGVEDNGMFGWYVEAGNIRTYTDKSGETYIDEAMSTDTKIYICEYYINSDISDDKSVLNLFLCEQVVDPEPAYEEAGPGVKSEKKQTATITLDNSREIPTISLSDSNVLVSPMGICIYDGALGFDLENYIHRIVLRYVDGTEYTLVDTNAFINNSMYALGQYGQREDASEYAGTEQGNDALPTPMPVDAEASANHRTTYMFNRLVGIDSLAEIILDDVTIQVG